MRLRTQVILTSISKSLKHVSVFILAIFLTRYFTKYEYGTYLQVMLIANFAVYFAVFGIPSSVYYFLPRSAEKKRLVKNTMILLFVISFLVSICIYLSIDLLAKGFNNPNLLEYGWLIAAFILLQIPIKLYEPFMVSTKNVARFVMVNATFNVGFLLAILIPVLLDWKLVEVLYSLFYFFIAQLIAVYIMTIYTFFNLEDDPEGDDYLIKEQLAYSLPIGFTGAIAQLGIAIDKMIVSGYYDPEELAVYTRGAMEIPMLNVIANSLGNILMPRFVEEYHKGNIDAVMTLWHSSIKMMAMFIYPTLVYFLLVADHLIPFLFTDAYLDSVIIFQVYTLGLLTRITSYDAIVRAVGKTKILFKMSILAVSLNILFTVILIELIGIVGAPLATVIVGTVLRFVYLVVITKLMSVSLMAVFPWISLAKLIGSALIAGALTLPIMLLDYSHATMLVISGVVFSIAYLVTFRFAKALSPKELESVRGLLPRQLRWIL
ncbi:MAG: oligosaccharide flippase family protein [Kangiellaceae bacterium]|nr:oligosaccharide flippase family protein [Kangiellaceae bacterium]